MNETLAQNLVSEIFAFALKHRTIMEIARQHLKYSYLQVESEKKIWEFICKYFDKKGRIPTIGQIQQEFIKDEDVLDKLLEIKDVEIDEEDKGENIVESLERFIKQMRFIDANDKIVDSYNKGKKEDAYNLLVKYAEEISHFSIKDAKFNKVFGGFRDRQIKRKSDEWNFRFKVPTLIDELDFRLGGQYGGPETGECVLWMGDSGTGKSQALIHVGIAAARQGFRVAHFQLEGTEEQCMNRYDAAWTGTLYQDMKRGDISDGKSRALNKIIQRLHKTDILVSTEENFNGKTLPEIRKELKEMERMYGKIDVITIDYLELMEVGDGHNYTPGEERFRQSKLGKGCKRLAIEFNAVVHTATQSSSINEEDKNDPSFVITRTNLSEDRGKIRPFDIFLTINQTREEAKVETMRLHTDKLREYKSGDPIKICNNFAYSRFYDRKKTAEADWEDE